MVAHELRTPLNAALGWLCRLRADGSASEHVTAVVDHIDRNLQLEARLVEDLLDVGRVGLGGLRLVRTVVDVREIVTTSIAAFEPDAQAKKVHLRFSEDGSSEVRQVCGDELRLRQVIWNLLSNALKVTPPGGVVDVSLRVDARWIRILVSDSGPGMDAAYAKVAFCPLARKRRRNRTAGTQGLGVGLLLVRALVELHGGSVAVDAGGGGSGATFGVALPRHLVRRTR
jgi:signal transduction histidine kinase